MKRTLKFQSSIDPKLFEKVENEEIFLKCESLKNNGKTIAGGASALRVLRAETWLTVYRSLPYQNRAKRARRRLHDGTLDHEKVVWGDHCSLKVPVNLHNCCEEGIEVDRNGIKR